ncbi:MAG TPA: family 43 glycosylhydrolase, partial [Prosthecobacter sp.]|nr:family 43 glycosylhydrolase [Prosthecobacter sp.]
MTVDGSPSQNCADPSIIRAPDNTWYVFCTSDPLTSGGSFRLIPILRSSDLVSWQFVSDVFSARPAWVAADSGLWAPAVEQFGGTYFLYYSVSRTAADGRFAIGVATSTSPAGPWTDSGAPVVESQTTADCGAPLNNRWVIDPDVVQVGNLRYIIYGSFCGGISVRQLSADGLRSDHAEIKIAAANRFEAAHVVERGGYFYLFLSANACCEGAASGYTVMVGRSQMITGPYLDKFGVDLNASRPGGTFVMGANGNRWIAPGHHASFTDFANQDWAIYHAVDRNVPLFPGNGIRRPLMLDPLDWTADGWPVVRGGHGPSDSFMPRPAAQPGQTTAYVAQFRADESPGTALADFSDEFTSSIPGRWSFAANRISLTPFFLQNGELVWGTQDADIYGDIDNAAVYVQNAPTGDYMVEVKVALDVPASGCCF